MLTQPINAAIRRTQRVISAVNGGVAAGARGIVVELATALVQAEVLGAWVAIVAFQRYVTALPGKVATRQEADVVGAEAAIVTFAIALAGGTDAGRALE